VGAVENIAVARETNMVSALEALKKSGVWVYGGAAKGGAPPWRVAMTGPVCIVLGGEGEGLRPLVGKTCDGLLTIPMPGEVGSLNVAAAGAILCYEVLRQRQGRPDNTLT
jgi:23S rRNA (guanosine2251-2'-O)-methyltransferase